MDATQNTLPSRIVSVDWSIDDKKRWMARAIRSDYGKYVVFPPEPVGDHLTLLKRRATRGHGEAVLIGFDFPIGLPRAYANRIGVETFRSATGAFGREECENFYHVSSQPTLREPFYPPPTQERARYSKEELWKALGIRQSELLRRCDERTANRGAAECLFWTIGGKQVGRAAIIGWRDVIAPALDSILIWPFDGNLDRLFESSGVVIAEIYPAEACCHLNLNIGSKIGRSKRRRADRRSVASAILACTSNEIEISEPARSWIEWGFLDEDDFDAMVGLLSMLMNVTGETVFRAPDDPSVRQIEGWILGLDESTLSSRITV